MDICTEGKKCLNYCKLLLSDWCLYLIIWKYVLLITTGWISISMFNLFEKSFDFSKFLFTLLNSQCVFQYSLHVSHWIVASWIRVMNVHCQPLYVYCQSLFVNCQHVCCQPSEYAVSLSVVCVFVTVGLCVCSTVCITVFWLKIPVCCQLAEFVVSLSVCSQPVCCLTICICCQLSKSVVSLLSMLPVCLLFVLLLSASVSVNYQSALRFFDHPFLMSAYCICYYPVCCLTIVCVCCQLSESDVSLLSMKNRQK